MSAVPATQPEKNAQRKKGKKEAIAGPASGSLNLPVVSDAANDGPEGELANGDAGESLYVKDLQRNIRNINKKLAAMQKVDSVVAENPNTSLDDLVAAKKINADQKIQALKKPSLQAQLARLEEQVGAFRKVEQEFQTRLANEKERLEASHKAELDSLKATHGEDAKLSANTTTRTHLLTISTFLRAAAARRQIEDDSSEESRAFEGLLLLLYGGDTAAVDAAEKLINGSTDGVKSTDGDVLNVSYARVKELAAEVAPFQDEAQQDVSSGATTDPTIAHAGLTELDASTPVHREAAPSDAQTDANAGAANAAGANWDAPAPTTESLQDSWVSVDPADADTDKTAQSAVPGSTGDAGNAAAGWGDAGLANRTGSWADDTPDPSPNDGFREVHHHRGGRGRGGPNAGFERRGSGRGRGRGGMRGSGEFRGRGGRGRGRAREAQS